MPNDTNQADPLDSEYRNQFSRVSHQNKKKNPKLGEIQADPASTGSSSSKTKTASFDSTTTDNTLVAATALNLTTPAQQSEKNGGKSSTIKCLPVSHDFSKEDQSMEIPISVKNSSDQAVVGSSTTAEKTS